MPEQKTADKNLIAGHAPATIVGGMRISQPKVHHPTKESPKDLKDKDLANNNSQDERNTDTSSNTSSTENAVVEPTNNHTIIVDGTPMRIEDVNPTEAVKKFHDKPLPTHDKQSHQKPSVMHFINQPRKC